MSIVEEYYALQLASICFTTIFFYLCMMLPDPLREFKPPNFPIVQFHHPLIVLFILQAVSLYYLYRLQSVLDTETYKISLGFTWTNLILYFVFIVYGHFASGSDYNNGNGVSMMKWFILPVTLGFQVACESMLISSLDSN
jgi:hypothetical protein